MSETEKPRTYGRWAGSPAGIKEDPKRCIESLYSQYSNGGRQCSRPRGFGPTGEYCKIHSPEAVESRREASSKRWKNKIARTMAPYEKIDKLQKELSVYREALADLNPEGVKGLLEALRAAESALIMLVPQRRDEEQASTNARNLISAALKKIKEVK